MIENQQNLIDGLEVDNWAQVEKVIYKSTSCGAWIDPTPTGIKVGSIVEGVEECTEVHALNYPFSLKDFWSAIQSVVDEADLIWNRTHGCKTCAKHWQDNPIPDELFQDINFICQPLGDDCITPVWDKCPDCQGQGSVI